MVKFPCEFHLIPWRINNFNQMKILIGTLCLIIALPAISQVNNEEKEKSKNMHQPKYCLFYDNHTMPAIPDIGENFDVEAFTDLSLIHILCHNILHIIFFSW